MARFVSGFFILVMIAGAIVTYQMKHEAEKAAERIARLNADIGAQKEALAVLKAELSLLSQPARLQTMIERYREHFQLEPFVAEQVATLDEIPLKPIEPDSTEMATALIDSLPAVQ